MNEQTWATYRPLRQPTRVRAQRWGRRPLCGCGCGQPAIWVGRGSCYANPFRLNRRITLTASEGRRSASMRLHPHNPHVVVRLFADYVGEDGIVDPILGYALHHPVLDPEVIRAELAGHDLACSCKTEHVCHADVLLQLANEDTGER